MFVDRDAWQRGQFFVAEFSAALSEVPFEVPVDSGSGPVSRIRIIPVSVRSEFSICAGGAAAGILVVDLHFGHWARRPACCDGTFRR